VNRPLGDLGTTNTVWESGNSAESSYKRYLFRLEAPKDSPYKDLTSDLQPLLKVSSPPYKLLHVVPRPELQPEWDKMFWPHYGIPLEALLIWLMKRGELEEVDSLFYQEDPFPWKPRKKDLQKKKV